MERSTELYLMYLGSLKLEQSLASHVKRLEELQDLLCEPPDEIGRVGYTGKHKKEFKEMYERFLHLRNETPIVLGECVYTKEYEKTVSRVIDKINKHQKNFHNIDEILVDF